MLRILLLVSCPLALGLSLVACSEQSNRRPLAGSIATTAAGLTALAPVGPFPRGQADPRRLPDPSSVGPILSVLSPARGATFTATTAEVVVEAHDAHPAGGGVATVTIAGAPAPEAGGLYRATVALQPGLNLVPIEAVDVRGNRTTSYVSLVQGTFAAPGALAADSLGLDLSPHGLRRVADAAESVLAGVDLAGQVAAANPLFEGPLLRVSAHNLRYDPMRLDLSARRDGVEATLVLDQLEFGLDLEIVGFGPARVDALFDRATARITAGIGPGNITGNGPSNQALGLEIRAIDLALAGLRLRTPSPLIDSVVAPLAPILSVVISDALDGALLGIADTALSGAIVGFDDPIRLDVPSFAPNGPPASVDLRFQMGDASGAPGGDLSLVAGIEAAPAGGASSGYLLSGVTLPPLALMGDDFAARVSADAINAFAHALWEAGALAYEIDGTLAPAQPGGLLPTARLLYPFLPVTQDLAPDPNTPLRITASLAAAPLVELRRDPAPYEVAAGEIELRLAIDYMDGGPLVELFVIRAAVRLEAGLALVNDEVVISGVVANELAVCVIAEPTVDLADQEIVDFLCQILPWLVDQLASTLKPMKLPVLPHGVTLIAPRLESDAGLLVVRGAL